MSENYTYAPVEHVTIKASELAVLRNRVARLEAALLACQEEQAQLRGENERLRMLNERIAHDEMLVQMANDDLRGHIVELAAKLAAVPVGAIMRTLFTGYRSSGQYTADADAINAWAAQQSEVQS